MNGANVTTALQQCLPLAVLKQDIFRNRVIILKLQQCLPLAVLKLDWNRSISVYFPGVATVLTACGIETTSKVGHIFINSIVATVLTACGIETVSSEYLCFKNTSMLQQCLPLAVLKQPSIYNIILFVLFVATVLTACGIETVLTCRLLDDLLCSLQQCLPLAVLKLL